MLDARAKEGSRILRSAAFLSTLNAEDASSGQKSGSVEEIIQKLKSAHIACSQALFHQWTSDSHGAEMGFRDAIARMSESIYIAEGGFFEPEESKLVVMAELYSCRGIYALMLGSAVEDSKPSLAKDAIADFLESLELNALLGWSHDNGIYFYLGQAYALSGNLDSAIESFERAIGADPNRAEAYLSKGLLHKQRGEMEQARHDIYRAVCLDASLYKEEFAPIMEAERESEAIWDELLSRDEADEALKELEDEARAMLRSMETD